MTAMSTVGNRRIAALLTAMLTIVSVLEVSPLKGQDFTTDAPRLALLVGCTEYAESDRIPTLLGPANDVPLFANLLIERMGFQANDVQKLVGWPDDDAARPTSANISAGFERLIERSRPGAQIVVLLAGHGAQAPISREQTNPLDPANPEPDGFDELFLPADVRSWSGSGLRNSIRDDQIALWLRRISEKGASVWIIFDCCHSGSMARSLDDVERGRFVSPDQLGIPESDIVEAARRATAANRDTARGLSGDSTPLDLNAATPVGRVAAFYAAQSYERAPELPQPSDAERSPENTFGLFSYSLVQTLQQSSGELSYRELARRLVSRYRAERGTRGPTPLFEGDLDSLVLGAELARARPIYVNRIDGAANVSAGSLRGLTPGTILSVSVPADSEDAVADVLGYVRVTATTPTSADVESVAYGERPAEAITGYPENARCEIASRYIGEMRLRVAAADPASEAATGRQSMLTGALNGIPRETAQLLERVENPAEAEWVLQQVTPDVAQNEYGVETDSVEVFLIEGGRVPGDGEATIVSPGAASRVFARYPVDDARELARSIGRDLRKIYTWRNVWRVVGTSQADAASDSRIVFDVTLGDSESPGDEAVAAPHVLVPGQRIELRISNRGFRDEWVTVMFLSADFGVETFVRTQGLGARQTLSPIPVIIDDSSLGMEGFVVFSIPTRAQREQPDYSFLTQTPLGVQERSLPAEWRPETAFEELMLSLKAASDVATRGVPVDRPTTPGIQSWSWVTAAER